MNICLTGDLEHCEQGIREIAPELSLTLDPNGLPISVMKGDAFSVSLQKGQGAICYRRPVELFRGLMLFVRFSQEGQDFCLNQKPCFELETVMLDVSRNAVLRPNKIKYYLRRLALMGIGAAMLYTEDTYEVKEYPYFGYMRGRYTYEELKELDDYAYHLGIELFPCIQTLSHLNRALHWRQMQHIMDCSDILLVGEEETYTFLEACLKAASAPYRSRRIHIGMDEAHDLGSGAYLKRNGYKERTHIIHEHLRLLLPILDQLGLEPMMWSDMYFRPYSPTGGYYDSPGSPQEIISASPENIGLVYWDYYHEDEDTYDRMLSLHEKFRAPLLFAGGCWTWCGAAPDYDKMLATTLPALKQCREHGISEVIITAWGDDGAECSLDAALFAFQIFAEYMYQGHYEESEALANFRYCVPHGDGAAFLGLTQFHHLPGVSHGTLRPANCDKFLLYQDPLLQLYETDMKGVDMSGHYSRLAQEYAVYRDASQEPLSGMFYFYTLLAQLLSLKCSWHERLGQAVRGKDKDGLKELLDMIPQILSSLDALSTHWHRQWMAQNKPFGYEIIDLRLGGLRSRFLTAGSRLEELREGRVDDIPEVTEPKLPYIKMDDGTNFGSYAWQEIISACKI